MSKRTLLTTLMVTALASGIASGQTVVKSGDGTIRVEVRVSAADEKGGGGWLGVRIVPVPPPLAAHLKTRTAGVMVGNLVKDGPAHKAGLERYDVIVAVDGKAVEDGSALVKAIGALKPGRKVDLAVVRKARKTTLQVVVGKPVPAERAQLVHKDEAPSGWQDVLRVHPRMIFRKGADAWERMDGKNLPEEIRKLMRSIPEIKIDTDGPNVRVIAKTVVHVKDDKGRDVQIEKDETGQITVRRKTVDKDGNETEDVSNFKDADALREMDKEAYDLLKKSHVNIFTTGKRFRLDIPKIRAFGRGAIDHRKLRKDIHEKLLENLERMNIPDNIRKMIREQIEAGNADPEDQAEKPTDEKTKDEKAKDKKVKKGKHKDGKDKDKNSKDAKSREGKSKDEKVRGSVPARVISPGRTCV